MQGVPLLSDGWMETGNADGHGLALCPSLRGNKTHKTSKQTASWQAARLQKEVCKGRPSAQLGSVSARQTFKPCFPFHLHKNVYVWTSDRRVCLYFLWFSSESPLL